MIFFQRFEILIFKCVWINCHLIVKNVNVAMPSLFILMEISQEFLIVGIAFAELLILLEIVAVSTFANTVRHQLVVIVHIYITSKPLYVDNLTTMTLLTNIIHVPVEESFLRINIYLAFPFFLKPLIH